MILKKIKEPTKPLPQKGKVAQCKNRRNRSTNGKDERKMSNRIEYNIVCIPKRSHYFCFVHKHTREMVYVHNLSLMESHRKQ